MKQRYNKFNMKRRIKRLEPSHSGRCRALAEKVCYGGNPEHKKNPGDFGLMPPSHPRCGKSLCDDCGITSKKVALAKLQMGLVAGLISERFVGKWPQNIWSVSDDGLPLEAQLENPEKGIYHGYPMPESDPLASEVIRRWEMAQDEV